MAKPICMIIDGSSLTYRAFYALPLLTDAAGRYTNAVYGLSTMLLRLLGEWQPQQLVVAFDKGKHTFRNEVYGDYKAHRKATPVELVEQFPRVRELAAAFGAAVLEQEGYEADDIIGRVSRDAAQEGLDVLIVTGDRDALQLVDSSVKVLLTRKGISEVDIYDEAKVQEAYGMEPLRLIDLKGLMGDTSDNIPGVPGIGEKTATKLLAQFGTLEEVLAQAAQVKGNKTREALIANADLALLSKKLATIVRDMPLTEDWRQSKPETGAALAAFFTQMDFRSLLARLTVNGTEAPAPAEQELAPLQWQQEQEALDWLTQEQTVAVWPLWDGARLSGLVLANGSDVCLFTAECAVWDALLTALISKPNVIGHDVKRLVRWVLQERQAEFLVAFDTALAAYLLDATQGEASFASVCLRYLGREESLASLPEQEAAAYSAKALLELHPVLEAQLDVQHMRALYFSLELPLVRVLAVMEAQGIAVDWLHLQAVNEELSQRIQELLTGIHAAAGEEFNVNSTKQLGVVLFEKLGLPVQKKTKTGYSTDAEVLEKLSGHHAVVDQLLEYRMLSKLKSTYLEGLSVLINRQNNRVYTHFNQMVTSTGRLSSSEPNLQNIPVRTETGRRIRELFVPGEGYTWLMSADYSQIELRVLAHMSGDESFIDAFLKNQDIHARTASEVFGVAMADVTSELRRRAKAVNFGIVYGISDYGLARDLGVSRNEAAAYIEGYFARYPKVKVFMENAVAQARKDGYAETMLGRRRYLTDINSRNFNQRSFAERTAMNTPIQGSAADIIKKAMLLVFEALQEKKLRSRLLLQVHDELVLEVTEEERNLVATLVKEKMEQAVCLQVPLLVDVHYGINWAQAK